MSKKKTKPKTPKTKISPEVHRHGQILDVVLDSTLGAIPYAHTAILLLDMEEPYVGYPTLGVKRRGAHMSREVLLRVTEVMENCLKSLKEQLGEKK